MGHVIRDLVKGHPAEPGFHKGAQIRIGGKFLGASGAVFAQVLRGLNRALSGGFNGVFMASFKACQKGFGFAFDPGNIGPNVPAHGKDTLRGCAPVCIGRYVLLCHGTFPFMKQAGARSLAPALSRPLLNRVRGHGTGTGDELALAGIW